MAANNDSAAAIRASETFVFIAPPVGRRLPSSPYRETRSASESTLCDPRPHAAHAHRPPLAIIARLRRIWRIHAYALPMGACVRDGHCDGGGRARADDAQNEHLSRPEFALRR